MVDDLRAAWIIVRTTVRSKLDRPLGLAMGILVNSLDSITPVLGVAALTHTFGPIYGWRLPEAALLVGTSCACVGVSLLVAGAFDSFLFVHIYRSGQLESALLRPGNPVVYLAATNFRPYRVGRIIAPPCILLFALIGTGAQRWQALAVLPITIVVGSTMLCALWFFDAAATIRLGQSNELTHNIPFIAGEMTLFPLGVYPTAVRYLAQFVLGLGAATYLPIAFALDKQPHLGVWSLVAGPALLPPLIWSARLAWLRAIRYFERNGQR